MARYYYLGPWQWKDASGIIPGWYPPEHTVGLFDLRASGAEACGFFATEQRLSDSAYVELGDGSDLRDYRTTRADRDAWRSELGLTTADVPEGIDTLADLLIWTFEQCGDPARRERFRPPTATHGGQIELHLGGHSRLSRKAFDDLPAPARERILKTVRLDMAELFELCNLTGPAMRERGIVRKPPRDLYRRVATDYMRKYRLDDHRLLFPEPLKNHVEPPLPVATTYADDSDRASLGAGWTPVDGSWDIYNSAEVQCTGGGTGSTAVMRYESDLSTDDHYCQVDFTYANYSQRWLGPCARFAVDSETGYFSLVRSAGGLRQLTKLENGSTTALDSDDAGGGPPQTVKVRVSGSTIQLYDDGECIFTVTDTAIAGNLRTGLCGDPAGTERGDNFLAEDLPVITVELDWTPSTSADVDHYAIRRSDAGGEVELSGPVHATAVSPPWSEDVTGLIGEYQYLVRAVDSDGNEEANISQAILVVLDEDGPTALPAEPRLVEARAIAGGRIELEWLYDPAYEYLGPGAAHEARIYWDAGTGEIDFTESHATVLMNNPTSATRFTWQSTPLTDGQEYRFVVRIANHPWPDGVETQNADEHAAVCDATQPSAPSLTAAII